MLLKTGKQQSKGLHGPCVHHACIFFSHTGIVEDIKHDVSARARHSQNPPCVLQHFPQECRIPVVKDQHWSILGEGSEEANRQKRENENQAGLFQEHLCKGNEINRCPSCLPHGCFPFPSSDLLSLTPFKNETSAGCF